MIKAAMRRIELSAQAMQSEAQAFNQVSNPTYPKPPAPRGPPAAFTNGASMKLELKQVVKIAESGETGTVIGRAEYSTTPLCSYLLRYKGADGRAREEWWTEDALEPA
jgi:hypothetical protein